jgi:hypothetical protein
VRTNLHLISNNKNINEEILKRKEYKNENRKNKVESKNK